MVDSTENWLISAIRVCVCVCVSGSIFAPVPYWFYFIIIVLSCRRRRCLRQFRLEWDKDKSDTFLASHSHRHFVVYTHAIVRTVESCDCTNAWPVAQILSILLDSDDKILISQSRQLDALFLSTFFTPHSQIFDTARWDTRRTAKTKDFGCWRRIQLT